MQKKIKKTVSILLAFLLVFCMQSKYGAAQDVTEGNGSYHVTADEEYLYITYTGTYSNWLSVRLAVDSESGYLGQYSAIVINTSNSQTSGTISVLDAWSRPISGAEGSVTNTSTNYDGTMTWSVKVPLSTYSCESDTLSVTCGGTKVSVADLLAEDSSEEEPAETEDNDTEPETEEQPAETADDSGTEDSDSETAGGDIAVAKGITIDGNYDDWDGYPMQVMTWKGTNANCNSYGQIAIDGDTLYVRIHLSDLYTGTMPFSDWHLKINGQDVRFQIHYGDEQIDWNRNNPSGEGQFNDLHVYFRDYPIFNPDSVCILNVYDGEHKNTTPGDDMEFSVNIREIAEELGIDPDEIGTITISNLNIGPEGITIAGTSTGPIIGICVCLASVGIGTVVYRRKKKHS